MKRSNDIKDYLFGYTSAGKREPHLVIAQERRFYYLYQQEKDLYEFQTVTGEYVKTVHAFKPIYVDVCRFNRMDYEYINTMAYTIKKGRHQEVIRLWKTEESLLQSLIKAV